ncbi:MAG TPA: GNAT family N-acetyltransferase [Nitrososphaerales archaeon]|nr:GNAT family N-acetyltransferase [Nitrososphaerales archaeon]
MSPRNRPKTDPPRSASAGPPSIRKASKADSKDIVELIVRLKRLNNEFDPLFGVVPDAKQRAEKYLASSFESSGTLLLVATSGGRVIGVVRAEIEERLFYRPAREGHITEMYILPEHRRARLGQELLRTTIRELTKKGAEIIVADLPVRNEIGVSFYTKRGFRRLTETFAQMPQ